MSAILRALLLAGAVFGSGGVAQAAPVTLEEALLRGTQASPRVVQARAQVEAARARAAQAGIRPNPEVRLDVENFGGNGPYRDFRQTETTLAVSQRLELGGKRPARQAVARADLDFAELSLTRALADLARDIRYAHAELRAAEARAGVDRAAAARARELVRTAALLVEAGRDPPLRQLRAEALLAEAEAQALRSFNDLLAARATLGALTGTPDPEASAIGPDDALSPPPLAAGIAGIDAQLATAQLTAAQARTRLAQVQAVPDLTLSGGVRRFQEGGDTAVVAGIALPLPIRDRNRGNIAAAQAETGGAEAGLAQARLDVTRLRRTAELALGAANERVAALSGAGIRQAEEAVRLAEIGYRAGKFSLLELIDAQNALLSAQRLLIEARADRARALADLARANAQ